MGIKTLAELQKKTHAYDDFRCIKDCNIDDYYKQVIPSHCTCGSEMILTEPNHTQLQCCNPYCHIKMGYRLAYFISKLGFKGFGEQLSLNLISNNVDNLKYPTFLSAFLLEDKQISSCLGEYASELFCNIRDDLKNNVFSFIDIISALGIPGVGSRSNIFDVVKSPGLLLKYVVDDKLDIICDMAGIYAEMTRFQLSLARLDIITLMMDVAPNIQDTAKKEIYVAITGKVSLDGEYCTRGEFIAKCESIVDSNGTPLYKLVETKSKDKLEYVITDGKEYSSKYQIGLELGILISSSDFYNKLLNEAKSRGGDNEQQ